MKQLRFQILTGSSDELLLSIRYFRKITLSDIDSEDVRKVEINISAKSPYSTKY